MHLGNHSRLPCLLILGCSETPQGPERLANMDRREIQGLLHTISPGSDSASAQRLDMKILFIRSFHATTYIYTDASAQPKHCIFGSNTTDPSSQASRVFIVSASHSSPPISLTSFVIFHDPFLWFGSSSHEQAVRILVVLLDDIGQLVRLDAEVERVRVLNLVTNSVVSEVSV